MNIDLKLRTLAKKEIDTRFLALNFNHDILEAIVRSKLAYNVLGKELQNTIIGTKVYRRGFIKS